MELSKPQINKQEPKPIADDEPMADPSWASDHTMEKEGGSTKKHDFESTSVLSRLMIFISDLHGGFIKLGWVGNPNCKYNLHNFELFCDNLITYGTGYSFANTNFDELFLVQKMRL